MMEFVGIYLALTSPLLPFAKLFVILCLLIAALPGILALIFS